MSTITENVELIRNQAKVFQAVIDMALILEGFGSIEQATQESQYILEKAQQSVQEAEAQLAAIKTAMEDSEEKSRSLVSEAKRRAKELLDTAKDKASAVIIDAETKREAHINDQRAICAALTEQATALQQQCDEATNELAMLEAKLTDTRAQIAKILGQ